MKTTLVILASVLLIAGILGGVYADSDTQGVTASVTVPGVISITSYGNMDFGSVAPDNQGTDTLDLTVDSNAAYDVEAKSNQANFNKDTLPDTTIADEKLEWFDGVSTWTGYDIADGTVIDSGSAGTGNPHAGRVRHFLPFLRPADCRAG